MNNVGGASGFEGYCDRYDVALVSYSANRNVGAIAAAAVTI